MANAKEYSTDKLRNLAVLGHGGSGKTSLIDALAYCAGSSKRRGKVSDGAALTWYRPEEKARGTSMYCTPAHAEWKHHKLNLIDTPGYLDFFGETVSGIRVADAGLLTVAAQSGAEVGTELVWEHCVRRGLPSLIVVTKMDKEHANFEKAVESIRARLSEKAQPVELPIGEGEQFRGVIDLLTGQAKFYKSGTQKGEYEDGEIPAELAARAETARTNLLETIATADETLMDRYLEGDTISEEELIAAFHKLVAQRDIFPIFPVAAEKTYGCMGLLDGLVELAPHPADLEIEPATLNGEQIKIKVSDEEPFAALVFKTASEGQSGELSYFKVISGSVSSGDEAENPHGGGEKLGHLAIPHGKERLAVTTLHAGDIGVVARLKHTHTGDTLANKERLVELRPPAFPEPMSRMAIHAESRNDEDKIGPALARLHEEEPCFEHGYDAESRETVLRGLGELHLEVQLDKLRERFGVKVVTSAPKVHYRETIRQEAKAHGRHKKQSGGRGQFGDCHIEIRPRPRGEGYQFNDKIVGGSIPGKFIPAVDKGIQEAAARGILAGYPVIDFEADCVDGSYHAVDSSEMAFKVAGSQAFKLAAAEASPVLTEPVIKVTLIIPTSCTGDVMGDITQRRGRMLGMDSAGDKTVIEALVPEAELYRYSTSLRSMTQGRGHHTREYYGLEDVPANIAERIVSEQALDKGQA